MRAVVLRAFGAPELLVAEDVPDPVAGPGQVLVKVAASSITFVETQVRAGNGPSPAHRPALPFIPGNGVGGTVVAVGEGVDAGLLGSQVVTPTGGSGGYAELAVAEVGDVHAVPDGLSLTDAVALLADGRTAMGLVRTAAPQAGERVLVLAAGGGVGSLLVQLARNAGAHVIGAASSKAKLRLAAELGASATVDYTAPDWTSQVSPAVDLVFDGVGGALGAAALGLVRDGGRVSVMGMASGSMTSLDSPEYAGRGLRLTGWPAVDMRELVSAALAEAAAGRLRPTIGQTFPLEQASQAHAAIESRTALGKTLLIP